MVDTIEKRGAMLPGSLPFPDGSIDIEDRQHMLGSYPILSEEEAPGGGESTFTPSGGSDYILQRRRRR